MPMRIPTLLTALVASLALALPASAASASAASHRDNAPKRAHKASKRSHKAGKRAHRRARHARARAHRSFARIASRQPAKRRVGNAVPVGSTAQAAASPSRPELLFSGSHVGDFWVNHSAPGAITEVSDPAGSGESVLQMNVGDGDVYPITPTENPRAELLSPDIVQPGQEVWLKTKFLIPADYPTVPDGGWVSLVSFYGAPFNGPSPWHLELAGDKLQWQRNGTYDFDVPWETPLVKGRWTEVLVHERFAEEGFIEMWINGQQVEFFGSGTYNPNGVAATQQLQMATMDASNDAGANSAKIMQYREAGMFASGSVYFGALKLGSSRAAVEG